MSFFQNYSGFIWLFSAYVYMVVVRITVPDPLASYLGLGGVFIFIVGIIFQGVYAKLAIADLRHIDAACRPSHRRRHFYFSNAKSYALDASNNKFCTIMILGKPFLHDEYGKVDKVYVYHYGDWSKRFRFRKAKAPFAGMIVDHGATDYATFYELDGSIKPAFIDHAKPYPTYKLIEAGGDYPGLSKILDSLSFMPAIKVEKR